MDENLMATHEQVAARFHELAETKTEASEEDIKSKEEYRDRNTKKVERSSPEDE